MIPEITIIVLLLLSFDGVCIQIDRLGADAAAARCHCLRMSTSTQIYKRGCIVSEQLDMVLGKETVTIGCVAV